MSLKHYSVLRNYFGRLQSGLSSAPVSGELLVAFTASIKSFSRPIKQTSNEISRLRIVPTTDFKRFPLPKSVSRYTSNALNLSRLERFIGSLLSDVNWMYLLDEPSLSLLDSESPCCIVYRLIIFENYADRRRSTRSKTRWRRRIMYNRRREACSLQESKPSNIMYP